MSSFYDDASLVVVPSGYKTSKIYAEKPTDGSGDLTFTRASNATRVGPDGLIEKVRTNLALYSEQFNDAYWTKTDITVTANTTANPVNGATTADTLTRTGAAVGFTNRQIAQTGIVTFSVYAKAGTTNEVRLNTFDGSADRGATYNLTTGAITSPYGSPLFTTSQALSNGWYRISISVNSATYTRCQIHIDTINSVIVFGAQLETGDIATDYIATTTTAVSVGPVSGLPRLDYLNSSCPRLLLEPQRSNVCLWSEQIDNAGWSKINSPTITTNIATAPDGYGGADGIQDTTSGSFKRIRQTFSVTANGTHTASVFVKKETTQTNFGGLALTFTGATVRYAYGIINPINGTIVVSSDSIIASSSTKVEDYGTYWRFSLTATDNQSNTSLEIAYYATISTNGTSTGLGTGSVRTVWGFQLEIGASYPSSYLPTLSTSVTRVADAASKTGISSLIGQTEGTIFLDFVYDAENTANERFSISDGTSAKRIFVVINTSKLLSFTCTNAGSDQWNISTSLTVGQRYKIAGAYKANDIALYVNGVQIGTDAAASIPDCSNLYFANESGTTQEWNNPTSQLLLFKTRLTNAQLAELTTL